MRKRVSWLLAELPRLEHDGVLTSEAAEALRRHYRSRDEEAPAIDWAPVLLACVGAVLVGGGIILILAHNWDLLDRPTRAAMAIGSLLAAQALTLFAVARRSGSDAWLEAASGLLVAATGASIALVGQTYHVGGSFEALMRTWLWLVVPLPYLTGSCLAAVGFWGLFVIRVGSLSARSAPLDVWPLALAALPFVVLRARRQPDAWPTTLVMWMAAGGIFLAGTFQAIDRQWGGLWAVFQVAWLAAVIAAASWPAADAAGAWRRRILLPAWGVLIVVGTILSFDDPWRRLTAVSLRLMQPSLLVIAMVAVACATFASIATFRLAQARRFDLAAATAAAILVVAMHALAIEGVEQPGWIAFNLWLLAVGALNLHAGIRNLDLGLANRGLFAIAALVIARFFDTDLSFLMRGLTFVALGIACFALNFELMRRLKEKHA